MDEFGVLTSSFGIKPQGKAAPMAALKRTTINNNNSQTKSYYNGGISDGHLMFGAAMNSNSTTQVGSGGDSSFDYDSFFSGSNSSVNYDNDDIFGVMPGVNSSSSANNGPKIDDIFGSFDSAPKQSTPIDDLLGDFVTATTKPRSTNSKSPSFSSDDLVSGFGAGNASNTRNADVDHRPRQSTKSTFASSDDPFIVLESTSTSRDVYASSDSLLDPLERISKVNISGGSKPPRLKSPPKSMHVPKGDKAKSSAASPIDELEDFAMGRVQNNFNGRSNSRSGVERQGGDDLESIFGVAHRSSSAPRSRTTTSDPIFDALNNNKGTTGAQPRMPPKTSSGSSFNIKKSSSASGIFGDLTSMFGGNESCGEFQEFDGESRERRNARYARFQKTKERVDKAVSDMNERDFKSQQEQEEKRRVAEVLEADIKRWAAGKEGNMRALLSSLQYVLWPECGWEAVSLTDLITSGSVKKVYRKAALYVHPDKVQQKGATIQQKYTAEKVFDILQEAWNKFNKEELR